MPENSSDGHVNMSHPYLCCGRDILCEQVHALAFQSKAVLLFGGRLSGKTTVLREVEKKLSTRRANVNVLDDLDLAVYVNLMNLPYDATPGDFFLLLPRLAQIACNKQIDGFTISALPSDSNQLSGSLNQFVSDMEAIFQACGETYLRVAFLLDESKRVLGDRFPRGFQDNLFALLFGHDLTIRDRISMVFAGAQDLYRFCEDDTSPIGSRASRCFVTNLSLASVQEIMSILCSGGSGEVNAEEVFGESGGHAGHTVRLIKSIATAAVSTCTSALEASRESNLPLFKIWVLSLSPESQCIQSALLQTSTLTFQEIARLLEKANYSRFLADRVCEELQFTGVAQFVNNTLSRCNNAYWEFVQSFSYESAGSPLDREVWQLIERVELTLRKVITQEYEKMWPGKSIDRIRSVIGPAAWDKIENIKAKSESAYPYSNGCRRDYLECMYVAQLVDLMISNQAWQVFKEMFRDKRQLQDLAAAITPVRNDRAHFAAVPQKELDRCRIACDDLLVILERSDPMG